MKEVNVLIVDDEDEVRKLMTVILKRIGVKKVQEASNPMDALRILKIENGIGQSADQGISLVFCDINMPEMDGISFLAEVRKSEDLGEIPIIMITAEATKERILASAILDVDAFVVKPFSMQTIETKMRKALLKRGSFPK